MKTHAAAPPMANAATMIPPSKSALLGPLSCACPPNCVNKRVSDWSFKVGTAALLRMAEIPALLRMAEMPELLLLIIGTLADEWPRAGIACLETIKEGGISIAASL